MNDNSIALNIFDMINRPMNLFCRYEWMIVLRNLWNGTKSKYNSESNFCGYVRAYFGDVIKLAIPTPQQYRKQLNPSIKTDCVFFEKQKLSFLPPQK